MASALQVSWCRAATADEALQPAAWKAGEARCVGAEMMRMRGNELGGRLLLVLREVGICSVGAWRPGGGSYSGRRWGALCWADAVGGGRGAWSQAEGRR
jgi:hypothetical protein